GGRAVDRGGAQLAPPSLDHRQERSYCRRRCNHAGRKTGEFGCGQLFHPGRNRSHTKERRHSSWFLDLIGWKPVYRVSLDPVGPRPERAEGAISHFSCLLQGRAESPRSSGSLTRRGGSFCVAHETSIRAPVNNSAEVIFFRSLGTCASINHSISRLHLDATCQT